jgi:hypothetical protein
MPIFESSALDPLGLWDPASPGLSFALEEAGFASPPPDLPVYRLTLPADLEASKTAIDSSAAAFERVEAALEAIPARLDGLVARERAAGVSFGASAPEPGPESDLLSLLAAAEREEAAPGGPASFGVPEAASAALAAARAQFAAFLAQIDRDLLHFAWVETNLAAQQLARTTVNWGGSAQTVWSAAASPEQIEIHLSILRFATQTRSQRLRLLVIVAGGAVKMAGLLAVPGGAALALPAVYRYVVQILTQPP